MPRNVRNFWLEADVDGQKSRIATGPKGKQGGMIVKIRQRDSGTVSSPLIIRGQVSGDEIVLEISNTEAGLPSIFRRITHR